MAKNQRKICEICVHLCPIKMFFYDRWQYKNTKYIYWGIGVNLMATGLALAFGVWWQAPGAPGAAVALSMGMLVEIVYLGWRVKPAQNKFQLALHPAA